MRIPEALREDLKNPLGVLLPEELARTPAAVRARLEGAPRVITVGDMTTERLLGFGVVPDLQITDGRERRRSREPPALPAGTLRAACSNPASEITCESVARIRGALSSEAPVRLEVRGEEDLLVIPVCAYAPPGSAVLYGQPGEGMVVVRIDGRIRRKTQTMLGPLYREDGEGDDETVAV